MPDISLTRNTQLSGRELQDTVSAMIHDLSGRSPYSLVRLSQSWASGSQINLSAPGHVSGTVTLRDGSPSTVTVQMDLLSSTAQSMRDRVIRDMNSIADQYLSRTGATTATTTTATATATATTAATAEVEESRREFDWNLFGNILANITTGVATGIGAINEAYAQTTAEQAVAVASDVVSGKQVFDGGVLYPAEEVSSKTSLIQQQSIATPVMVSETPSWIWWALGIGGAAAAVGLIVYLVRR